jgi:tetratricopeptide (TPR) repeat protein
MNESIHRLSAIVFTDIVGYTSMMGSNEDNALKVLGTNKKIHTTYFEIFHATYYKQIGDGFLAIFDSVLEAVYACGLIQNECKKNNIDIRIGIHQGEVIFKDNDVFGDEVNIASRIENAVEKGLIYVSENVKSSLANKTGVRLEFVRECTLKNVEDPDWLAPYVGIAESYFMEVHYGYKSYSSNSDSIDYFISKARDLNPDQGELYCLQATQEFWNYKLKNALGLYKKAIELNPNYPYTYYYMAWIYLLCQNVENALPNLNKASNLDPLNEYFKIMKPIFLSFAGKNEEAVSVSMEMLESEPGNNSTLFSLGVVYSNMKEYEKALNTLLKRSVGHNSNFMVAFNYAKTGQTEKAREILDYLVQLPDDKAPPTTQIGIVYLGLEDYNNAIKWFQKGLQTNDQWYVWMEQSWADPIKNDPRYIDLINSIKSEFDL